MRSAWLQVVVGLVGCPSHGGRAEEAVVAAQVQTTLRARASAVARRPTIGALRAAVHVQGGVRVELVAPSSWRFDDADRSPAAWNRADLEGRTVDLERGTHALGVLADRLRSDLEPPCAPGTLEARWAPDRAKPPPELLEE